MNLPIFASEHGIRGHGMSRIYIPDRNGKSGKRVAYLLRVRAAFVKIGDTGDLFFRVGDIIPVHEKCESFFLFRKIGRKTGELVSLVFGIGLDPFDGRQKICGNSAQIYSDADGRSDENEQNRDGYYQIFYLFFATTVILSPQAVIRKTSLTRSPCFPAIAAISLAESPSFFRFLPTGLPSTTSE